MIFLSIITEKIVYKLAICLQQFWQNPLSMIRNWMKLCWAPLCAVRQLILRFITQSSIVVAGLAMESFHLVKKGWRWQGAIKARALEGKRHTEREAHSSGAKGFFYRFNHDPERNTDSLRRTPAASRWVSHESFHVSFCCSNTHYPLEEERENRDYWNVVLTEME